eukprot:scaffold14560_cov60-Phaeocystis_antarctica.AAC.6
MIPALRLAVLHLVKASAAMLRTRTSSPSTQGDNTRKSNCSKKELSCKQLSGRPNASMLRFRTSKTLSNEATDAGIATLKTLSTRATICAVCSQGSDQRGEAVSARVHRRRFSYLGLIGHDAQALAWLAPAAPTEQEEHGQARRLTRVKVPRAAGDVADSAVRPGGPWLAQHAIHIYARRRVGRGRVGAAPQIGAVIVGAPVPRYQGKQGQSGSRPLAIRPDRAWLAKHIASGGFAVVVLFLTLAVFDTCRAFARLGKLGALLARASIDLVDQRASLTVTGARQAFAKTDLAFTSGWCGASSGAPGRYGARLTCLLAFPALKAARLTLVARTHHRAGRDRAGAALGLFGAARRCIKAWVSLRALAGAAEVDGAGIRALRARQRRAGTLWAERSGLAGNAGLLALAGLVLARGAFVTEGSARGGRNEAGRAVSAVGWVGAPRNRIGLSRSARLARRAAILAAVWVERAGGARRERLPQARRSFSRTRATAWTVAALGRADVLAQLARRARQAACASLVRVVGTGCARNAACLHQAGDPDGKVCSGRTLEWLNGRSRAVTAAAVALATASVVRLLARVAEVAKCARIRAAGEVPWGQGQRRWRDPQAERAVDDGIFPQVEHSAGWARGLGRGERHIP